MIQRHDAMHLGNGFECQYTSSLQAWAELSALPHSKDHKGGGQRWRSPIRTSSLFVLPFSSLFASIITAAWCPHPGTRYYCTLYQKQSWCHGSVYKFRGRKPGKSTFPAQLWPPPSHLWLTSSTGPRTTPPPSTLPFHLRSPSGFPLSLPADRQRMTDNTRPI